MPWSSANNTVAMPVTVANATSPVRGPGPSPQRPTTRRTNHAMALSPAAWKTTDAATSGTPHSQLAAQYPNEPAGCIGAAPSGRRRQALLDRPVRRQGTEVLLGRDRQQIVAHVVAQLGELDRNPALAQPACERPQRASGAHVDERGHVEIDHDDANR